MTGEVITGLTRHEFERYISEQLDEPFCLQKGWTTQGFVGLTEHL